MCSARAPPCTLATDLGILPAKAKLRPQRSLAPELSAHWVNPWPDPMHSRRRGLRRIESRASALLAASIPPNSSVRKVGKQAERQRKAAQAREKEAAARHDLRTEVQPQVDRAAVRFLQHSVPDPLGTGNVDSIGQNLVTERRPKTSRSLSAYRTATGRTPSPCPMGASSSWRGCWPSWTTEAQLATVPGREIAHVVESHTLEAIRRSWNDQERDKLVGAAAGAALGGILGGKKGGAEAVVGAATAGAIAAAAMAGAVNGFLRGKDSRRQETEADLA